MTSLETPPNGSSGAPERRQPSASVREIRLRARASVLASAARLTWVAGLVLALSSFMGWYSGTSVEGPTISVTGWDSGTIGKLVFLIGLAVVCLSVVQQFGVEFPRSAPAALIVIALGALGTVFVLIRLISIPEELVGTGGRSVGIWISLFAAVAVTVGGLLQANEEL
jgi:hypothetical protein